MTEQQTLCEDLQQRLMAVTVPTITAVLIKKGFPNTFFHGLGPLNPNFSKFAGPAFTMRSIPIRPDIKKAITSGQEQNLQKQAMANVQPGQVLIGNSYGQTQVAMLGDIIATHLHLRGVAGVVLECGVSDAEAVSEVGLPVFCRGSAPVQSLTVVQVVELQVPIGCTGVPVFPGDILVGDPNGVVCIPVVMLMEVLEAAETQEHLEEFILERVQAGAPLAGLYPPDQKSLEEYAKWARLSS